MSCVGFTQSQDLAPAQKWFDCSAQASPELDLAGDGSLCDFRSKTRVKNEGIGKLNRLTHSGKVALCYRKRKGTLRRPGRSGSAVRRNEANKALSV